MHSSQGVMNGNMVKEKNLYFKTIEGNDQTRVSILGYASELLEYKPGFDAGIYVSSTPIGLVISAVSGHRLYTNNKWPNPVVLKIENIKFKPATAEKNQKTKIDGAK